MDRSLVDGGEAKVVTGKKGGGVGTTDGPAFGICCEKSTGKSTGNSTAGGGSCFAACAETGRGGGGGGGGGGDIPAVATVTPECGRDKVVVGWVILEGVGAGLAIGGGGGRSNSEEVVDDGADEAAVVVFIGVAPFPTRDGGGGGGGKSIEDRGSSESAAGIASPDVGALSNLGMRSIVS